MKTTITRGLAALTLCTLSACVSVDAPRYNEQEMAVLLSDKPVDLQPLYRDYYQEGPRNDVLHLLRIGRASIDLHDYARAEAAFAEATDLIELVYAHNDSAREARSVWENEDVKDFKGEPYERSMAFYYRGLLCLRKGDLQNAKACFKNAVLQDSMAEDDDHRMDFAAMHFLHGWACQQSGDLNAAERSYAEVAELVPGFEAPWDDDVLAIAELGNAPLKVNGGEKGEWLKFERGALTVEQGARVRVGEEIASLELLSDVAYQAMTRGDRAIDHINREGVVFQGEKQEQAEDLGNMAVAAGQAAVLSDIAGIGGGDIFAIASLGLGLLSASSSAEARAAQYQADTRAWDNLPAGLHFATFSSEELSADATVQMEYVDAAGGFRGAVAVPVITTPDGRSALAWAHRRPGA